MSRKVAIAGITGNLGKYLVDAFTSPIFKHKYQLPIHALTRETSGEKPFESSVVKYFATGDFADIGTLKEALAGVDVLIDVCSDAADRASLYKGAIGAGVKLIIPGSYGNDQEKSEFFDVMHPAASDPLAAAHAAAGVKVVEFQIGFMMRWNIQHGALFLGIDDQASTAKRYGGGDFGINFTAEEDLAMAIASVAYRDPSSLPDKIQIQSDRLSYNDIYKVYEKISGNTVSVQDTLTKDEVLEKARAISTEFRNQQAAGNSGVQLELPQMVTILKAMTLEAKTFTFDQDDNKLVNSGLWSWKKFDQVAAEYWG